MDRQTDRLAGNLLIWKNFDPAHADGYQHASRMLLIDTDSGNCQALHPEFAGPQARRSSDGVVVANAFYLFGGQGEDQDWRNDAHRYEFQASSDSGSTSTPAAR